METVFADKIFYHSLLRFWTKTKFSSAVFVSRPDGEKKAYVRLAPDYDALDVANKVRLDWREHALCDFKSVHVM